MLNCCKMSVTSLFMHLNCTLLHEVLILVWFLHIHVWVCLYFVVLRAYGLLSFYWINDLKMWRRILLGITAMNTSNCHLCVSSPLACILNKKTNALDCVILRGLIRTSRGMIQGVILKKVCNNLYVYHTRCRYGPVYLARCVNALYIMLGVGTVLFITPGVGTALYIKLVVGIALFITLGVGTALYITLGVGMACISN